MRQFLHAIHACPTAAVAWLNASEVCGEKKTRLLLGRNLRNKAESTGREDKE